MAHKNKEDLLDYFSQLGIEVVTIDHPEVKLLL